MTYKDLIQALADSRDIPNTQAREILEAVFDVLQNELCDGKGVSIPDLGTFKTEVKESRKIYSPHHDSYMMVPQKRIVDFSPSTSLKENLKFVEPGNE